MVVGDDVFLGDYQFLGDVQVFAVAIGRANLVDVGVEVAVFDQRLVHLGLKGYRVGADRQHQVDGFQHLAVGLVVDFDGQVDFVRAGVDQRKRFDFLGDVGEGKVLGLGDFERVFYRGGGCQGNQSHQQRQD